MAGVMRSFSKEYFTRKTIPRKRTKPPIQAKSFTPKNASQSIGGGGGGAAGSGGGTPGKAARVGIASATGVGDVTAKPPARDSNSPMRRPRLRKVALIW